MRELVSGLTLFALAACATVDANASRAVFRNPDRYLGQRVSVCGYLIGTAVITERSDDMSFGLNLSGNHGPEVLRRARRNERARACLSGTIRYTGCRSPGIICNDWAYDYAIEASEIR